MRALLFSIKYRDPAFKVLSSTVRRPGQFSRYEKLDHFHFIPLFSGDDAGVVRKHSKFI
jgi:hypothetical protein